MALFELGPGRFAPVTQTTFAAAKVQERKDLQRLLRSDISPLGSDLLVIAEEYCNWEESNRRIDLLCLDKEGRLVVVEIKRTEDGGHMELQALRYAAMVSNMTLEQAITAYASLLGGDDADARAKAGILEFLELASDEVAELSGDVRVILVSADFSTELTTSVIWLNNQGLDIVCIRLIPYLLGDRILVDLAQIIPLPEAADYEVKVRTLAQETKKARTARKELLRRFWSQLIERSKSKTALLANRSPTTDHWMTCGIGRAGFSLNVSVTSDRGRVECYVRFGSDTGDRAKAAFRELKEQKATIERDFGGPLDWQELPGRIGSRICYDFDGGWSTPEGEWPSLQEKMIDGMQRLERALREPIRRLSV